VRVTRCFAFLDLCGFTEYTASHGDAAAVAVLAQLRATLRAEAENLGVRVTKWLGDGAMLSGVEPGAVIACCLHVRDRIAYECPLPLRAGVCAGPVIMFEGDDYIGGAVNVAARLCDAAKAGQILAAESALAAAPGNRFETRELPSVTVDGVGEVVGVADILGRG
jgi:adenylate cyclase